MNRKASCPERSGSTGAEVGVLVLILCNIGAASTRVATGPRLLPYVSMLHKKGTIGQWGEDCIY